VLAIVKDNMNNRHNATRGQCPARLPLCAAVIIQLKSYIRLTDNKNNRLKCLNGQFMLTTLFYHHLVVNLGLWCNIEDAKQHGLSKMWVSRGEG
jgi:hypothetical protein